MRNKVLFIFLLGCSALFGQTAQQAEQLFFDKQYAAAADIYHQMATRTPQNALYNYRYARCLYELSDYDNAITYFIRSGKKYTLTSFYLGESCFRTYRFAQAEQYFNDYALSIDTTNANWEIVNKRLRQCQVCQRHIKHVKQIELLDTIVIDKKHFLDTYRISKESGILSTDANGLVTFINGKGNRKITTQRDSVGILSFFVSEQLIDGWTQESLFFRSEQDINYPFLDSDGITLYYAEENIDGMGGLDIFTTRYNSANDDFLRSENMGFPFNSPYNDYMLAIDEVAGIGYFASDRATDTSHVAVYKFKWEEGVNTYLDNINDTIVRQYAQLEHIEITHSEATEIIADSHTATNAYSGSIYFVVNESIIYTSFDDFKSAEALDAFKKYSADSKKLNDNIIHLEQLRTAYKDANDNERTKLRNTIIVLEQTIESQRIALKTAEKHIRQLELNK